MLYYIYKVKLSTERWGINMSIKDFKVGDKVYIRDYDFRENEDSAKMEEAVVTKVGTKVVTVQDQFASTYKFRLPENGETIYLEECVNGTRNKLFRTMDDFEDWKEKTEAVKYLYRYFNDSWNMNTMSIDKIRKIMDIIKES